MENNMKQDVNQETMANEETASQSQQPIEEDVTVIELSPKASKALKMTRKVLKVAVPIAGAVVAGLLGFKYGATKEKKNSLAAAGDYEDTISQLRLQLEDKSITENVSDIPVDGVDNFSETITETTEF